MGKKEKSAEPAKDKFDGIQLDVKEVQTVVLNLASEEEDVLTSTCQACFNFVMKDREGNSLILMELGAIQKLTDLIMSQMKNVRRYSLMVLGIMSSNYEVRKALVVNKNQIVSDCTNLIQDDDAISVEFAAEILSNLCVSYKLKNEFVEFNTIPLVAKLLSSHDPDTKKHALVCLLTLVNDFEIRMILAELETVVSALALIDSEYPVIQQLTLRLMNTLCTEIAACEQLINNDGINKLLHFIENREYLDTHKYAIDVISRCMTNEEQINNFNESGALQRLLTAVRGNVDQPMGEDSAIKLTEFIFNLNKALKIFVENGTAEIVTKMIHLPNDSSKIAALRAIRIIAKEPTFRDQAADMGITLRLIQLLEHDQEDMKREAILALTELIQNHDTNMGIAISNNVASQAVILIQSLDHDLICGALALLISMSEQAGIISTAMEAGLLPALELISHEQSTQIQIGTLDTMRCFITTDIHRQSLTKSSMLEVLVDLLNSLSSAVRKAACLAVMAICKDERTATAMVKAGIVDVLQEVSQSANRRSNMIDSTLTQVLDYNLSAKYSIRRKLYQTNHIKDGFYDTGIIDTKSRFVHLNKQTEAEVNDRLPVLVVNIPDNMCITESLTHLLSHQAKSTEKIESKTERKVKRKNNTNESCLDLPEKMRKTVCLPSTENLIQQIKVECTSMLDENLIRLMMDTFKQLDNSQDLATQLEIIGKSVSEFYGGVISKPQLYEFGYEMEIIELKRMQNTNVIPLGMIKKGLFRERALTFKIICDQIGLPVTLVQGEYGRAWNTLFIDDKECLVDLMTVPGRTYPIDHPNATDYISL